MRLGPENEWDTRHTLKGGSIYQIKKRKAQGMCHVSCVMCHVYGELHHIENLFTLINLFSLIRFSFLVILIFDFNSIDLYIS